MQHKALLPVVFPRNRPFRARRPWLFVVDEVLVGCGNIVVSPRSSAAARPAVTLGSNAAAVHASPQVPISPLRAGTNGSRLRSAGPSTNAALRFPPLKDLSLPGRHPRALLPGLLEEDAYLSSTRHRGGLFVDDEEGDGLLKKKKTQSSIRLQVYLLDGSPHTRTHPSLLLAASPLCFRTLFLPPTVCERSPAPPRHRCGFDGPSCALIGHCGSARHPRSFFHAPHCDANDSRFHCGVGRKSCQSTRMRSRSTRPFSFVRGLFLLARLKRITRGLIKYSLTENVWVLRYKRYSSFMSIITILAK